MRKPGDRWRRRLALALILCVAAVLFSAANFASSAWVRKRQQLAQQWTATADALSLQSYPRDAVAAYRNALAYNDDPAVRFRMAQAMIAAGDPAEAEAYLRSLLAEEPGKAEYNLALAHLYQAQDQAQGPRESKKAESYYRAALLGRWDNNPIQHRLTTNLELVRLLLEEKSYTDARATLISLTADMPKDEATQLEIAHLFSQAGDTKEAATIANQVLHFEPQDGKVHAFYAGLLLHSGDFRRAVEQFQIASESAALAPEAQSEFELAKLTAELDPYARGLRASDESARLEAVLAHVQERLLTCPSTPADRAQAQQWLQTLTPGYLHNKAGPDMLDEAVRFAAVAEQHLAACPGASPTDTAIQLLGRQP